MVLDDRTLSHTTSCNWFDHNNLYDNNNDALKRCRVYGQRAGGAHVVDDGGSGELPIIRGGESRPLDVSTIPYTFTRILLTTGTYLISPSG
jgi:hypothetical protein